MGDDRDGVTVEKGLLLMAFGRDVDYHDTVPQLIYLDRHTGDIVWLYGSDDDAYMETGLPVEENREGREAVAAEPDRYLEIPGLDHEDHHRMLRLFLRSRWTDDKERLQRAEDAYTGSIGRWKRDVEDEDAIHAFYAYREAQIEVMAAEFLRENGMEPNWRSFG